jgi:hypothetical protein
MMGFVSQTRANANRREPALAMPPQTAQKNILRTARLVEKAK